jgi:hypothetical protein
VIVALSQAYPGSQSFLTPSAGAASSTNGHFFEQISISSDLVVMNAIVPNWMDSAVLRPTGATANQLVLTAIDVAAPESRNVIAVDMTIDSKASDSGNGPLVPMLMSFSPEFGHFA